MERRACLMLCAVGVVGVATLGCSAEDEARSGLPLELAGAGEPAGPAGGGPFGGDPDHDGIPSLLDNCPDARNPEQQDRDGDGYGNACDDCSHAQYNLLCGLPPDGSWLTYDTYVDGCGCTDPDGADPFTTDSVTLEIPQPLPIPLVKFSPPFGPPPRFLPVTPHRVRVPVACSWPQDYLDFGDVCLDEDTVWESVCGDRGFDRRAIDCQFACRDGVCVCDTPEADSDGGDVPFERGESFDGAADTCERCTRTAMDGQFVRCVEWSATSECTGDTLTCRLAEVVVAPGAGSSACVSSQREHFCGAGCANGACNTCPEGDRRSFVPEGMDRCEDDAITLEEWSKDPTDPTCQREVPVDTITCLRGCLRGACVCQDTDRRSPHVSGEDAFGRPDECDGSDLLERWTEPGGPFGCEPRELRVACAYGCGDGRCLPAPGAPTFTFACVPFGTEQPQHIVDLQCRRGVAELIDNAGIGEIVDVAITTGVSPVALGRIPTEGEDLSADVASIPGDMLVVLTDVVGGEAAIAGYSLAGARWVVAELVDAPDNETIPHELGHVFSIVRADGSAAHRICIEDECEHICDERTSGEWGTQNELVRCVNGYPLSCDLDNPCGGHLIDRAAGVYCYYGRSGAGEVPQQAYSFTDDERSHLQRWFTAWAVGR